MPNDCKQSVHAYPAAAEPDLEAILPPEEAGAIALGARVQEAIEAMILDGRLPPGGRLNEIALARLLGVSRGPVREAARALERTGLVTVIMNRGAFVRTLSLDEAIETYEVATLLFAHASRQLAVSATAGQALELVGLVNAMDDAIGGADRERFFALNSRLHRRIVEMGRNRAIAEAYLEYTKKLLLFRRRSFEPQVNMAEANAEHRRLVDAILAGDGDGARARAEEHGRAGRGRFLAAIDYSDSGSRTKPRIAALTEAG